MRGASIINGPSNTIAKDELRWHLLPIRRHTINITLLALNGAKYFSFGTFDDVLHDAIVLCYPLFDLQMIFLGYLYLFLDLNDWI